MPMRRIATRVTRSRWLLPLALAGAVVVLAINEASFQRSSEALAALDERVELRRDVMLLGRRIADAESGQRGYLLTGREEYLEPYNASVGSVRALAQHLAQAYADDTAAAPMVDEIVRTVEGRLSELQTALILYEEGRHEAWHALVGTNIGMEKMEVLRSASERLSALETGRIAAQRDGVSSTLRTSRWALSLMAALSVLALFLFLRQSRDYDASQRRHAEELKMERDQLEAEVARRTTELSELAEHLQTAREDERARLARELHDELGALLTAAKLDAARLKRGLAGLGVPVAEAEARLEHLNHTIDQGIGLKRRIIEDLRPSALSNLGLRAALEILTQEFAQRSELALQADLEDVAADERRAIGIYRLVQESLTNIAKHAQASRVTVALRAADGGLQVEVADDGCGFDPAEVRGSRHGLRGMRHRVVSLGGRLQLVSRPGGGTRLQAWLPRASADEAAAQAPPDTLPPEPLAPGAA